VIQAYFPTLSYPKVTASWAGYYSYNTIDGAPYIFKELNIIVATGTSGSGILKGDAIGRFVEAVYSGREYVDLYNGSRLKTSLVGISNRHIEKEKFII
jgi:glycine/D-amino acid oxidase-like deaminating enzyme